eukprot:c9218_g1_i3.p1 GENE.c9218_g1_i3~~c9218_g1_i3.p1  ORF type:complete len:324 (-),score=57.65 c9218_g1_i3:828-1799(-)
MAVHKYRSLSAYVRFLIFVKEIIKFNRIFEHSDDIAALICPHLPKIGSAIAMSEESPIIAAASVDIFRTLFTELPDHRSNLLPFIEQLVDVVQCIKRVIECSTDATAIEPSPISFAKVPQQHVFRHIYVFLPKLLLWWLQVHSSNPQALTPAFISVANRIQPEFLPNLFQHLIRILSDHDDMFVNVWNDLLKLFVLITQTEVEDSRVQALRLSFLETFEPHRMFVEFLVLISFDHQTFVDLLINGNSCHFLEYLLAYLTYVLRHPNLMKDVGDSDEMILACIARARILIEGSLDNESFPFNARPLVAKMEMYETLLDKSSSTV